MSLETDFDPVFTTLLALKEKQIQQNYRPIIGVHKWFARRPGTVFRNLLLAEFNGAESLDTSYWRAHQFKGVIADPFMGGGTPVFEANRLGFSVVGVDVNPVACWVVRQSLGELDLQQFRHVVKLVVDDVEPVVGDLYQTRCIHCRRSAPVKYFLWVKTETCPSCGTNNDLFPGYLLATDDRHPKYVVACPHCGELNEYDHPPRQSAPGRCQSCKGAVQVEGTVRNQRVQCRNCRREYPYPQRRLVPRPPTHRLWALEYHCLHCKPRHQGRFFKRPDEEDAARVQRAVAALAKATLPIPEDEIPNGDETARLHRWGYHRYREMFNERQLFGLGTLLARIRLVPDVPARHALLTVFSDFLRYQNMLCRYDTYALKCQDIFSVHGFPVGLVQCENSLLGIPYVGSGSFRHFVEKYVRAKEYCRRPFETRQDTGRKQVVPIAGERIEARLVQEFPRADGREAWLLSAPAVQASLPLESLDGVFTDPPYFDNVQYAELMDFCFVWLRLALADEFAEFRQDTTRNEHELTGNQTLGRGLEHFTAGLSAVFRHYAAALKPYAPFVFTYHHNDPAVYAPLVVAILDAGLDCTATLPVAAEMSASLHIAGTGSSILDSVFVCRRTPVKAREEDVAAWLAADAEAMRKAGVRVMAGDVRCLAAGHIARLAINRLRPEWDAGMELSARLARARGCLERLSRELRVQDLISRVWAAAAQGPHPKETPVAATL
ncbi:MAG: DNA methylase [Acidobacteria bacterium]|nr:DNA methylase [Acidobacteriota bacterium]